MAISIIKPTEGYTSESLTINGLTVICEKSMKTVSITVNNGSTLTATSINQSMGTIPSAYRPTTQVMFKDNFANMRISISPAGEFIAQGQEIPAGYNIRGTFTYISY